jgi:hypothetical protein
VSSNERGHVEPRRTFLPHKHFLPASALRFVLTAKEKIGMESNEFDGAFKKKMPMPRRRRQAAADEDLESSVRSSSPSFATCTPARSSLVSRGDEPFFSRRVPQVPTAAAATSGEAKKGWGDSPTRGDDQPAAPAGRRRRGAGSATEPEPEAVPTQHAIASMEDDDGPAAFIPDLEDAEEDLGRQVAVAPSLNQSRVPTIEDLDEEIDLALPSASEVGVDLSVLQAFLLPHEHVQEEDVAWEVGHELQTIASEMQREAEEREGTALSSAAGTRSAVAAAAGSAAHVS